MASRELETDFDVGSNMTTAYSSMGLTSILQEVVLVWERSTAVFEMSVNSA